MHTISFALVPLFTSTDTSGSGRTIGHRSCRWQYRPRIHIIGIDTPKLGQKAHCGLERMLAARAMSRLRQIVRSGERIEVEKEACSIDLEGMARRSVVTPGTAGR